jgi:hypothetical protein
MGFVPAMTYVANLYRRVEDLDALMHGWLVQLRLASPTQ